MDLGGDVADQMAGGDLGDANVPGLGRLNEVAMLSCTLAGMLNLIVFLDALLPTGYGRRREEGDEELAIGNGEEGGGA